MRSSQEERGNYVRIDHGDGIETLYQHLDRAIVSVGDDVAVGQQIAWSGDTGKGSGPHLHFEVILNGSRTDPKPFMLDRGITLGTGRYGPVLSDPGAAGTSPDDLGVVLIRVDGTWYVMDVGARTTWAVTSSTLFRYLAETVKMPVVGEEYNNPAILSGFTAPKPPRV